MQAILVFVLFLTKKVVIVGFIGICHLWGMSLFLLKVNENIQNALSVIYCRKIKKEVIKMDYIYIFDENETVLEDIENESE